MIRREISLHREPDYNNKEITYKKGCYLLDSFVVDDEYYLTIELPCGKMEIINSLFYDVVFIK